MLAFEGRLDIHADSIRDSGIIGWAARDGAKPGRSREETWVVQAHGSWSAQHLEAQPDEVAERLCEALLAHASGATPPPLRYSAAHRWRFAMTPGVGKEALWNQHLRLGACGDWLRGPRVELAWLSGRYLGEMILASAAEAA